MIFYRIYQKFMKKYKFNMKIIVKIFDWMNNCNHSLYILIYYHNKYMSEFAQSHAIY